MIFIYQRKRIDLWLGVHQPAKTFFDPIEAGSIVAPSGSSGET